MIRCIVNLLRLNPSNNGGVWRIAWNVSKILIEAKSYDVDVFFLVGWQFSDQFHTWINDSSAKLITCFSERTIVSIIEALEPDLIVSPLFGAEEFWFQNQFPDVHHIVSIPDTLALDRPNYFSNIEFKRRKKVYDNLPKASTVVTISEFSRARLLANIPMLKNKIHVIPLAGNIPEEKEEVEDAFELPQHPYYYYPANGWFHKRHHLLFSIFREILNHQPEKYLVLTGGISNKLVEDLCGQANIPNEKVLNLGFVSNVLVSKLYQNAEALLFVSEYEGFGMPVLEAMELGCPAVCERIGSLPEIAGDAAVWVHSSNPLDWVTAILETLPNRRNEIITKGHNQAKKFSWAKTNQNWKELIKSVVTQIQKRDKAESQVNIPFREVTLATQEWATEFKGMSIELEKKEVVIQELTKEIDVLREGLKARDQLLGEYQHSIGYWFLNNPLTFRHKILKKAADLLRRMRKAFLSSLGTLYQHSPRKLQVPENYIGSKTISDASKVPTISIITPSLNQGQFIEETIISVLEQGYPNLEYGVQDGGSLDNTLGIAEKYKEKLSFFDISPDEGQANAINTGFAKVEGEIMAFLNADDILLPGALFHVGTVFMKNPEINVIYGNRIIINEDGLEIGRWILPPHDDNILLWADYVPQETMFWRRSIWEKAGAHIDETFQFALDWDLLLRFRTEGAKFYRTPRFISAFRVHPSQKTSSNLDTVGAREMAKLRRKYHGFEVGSEEINTAVKPYLRKAWLYEVGYRLRLWK